MLIINNKALKISNRWLNPVTSPGPPPPPPDPYNPLGLPANTVRVRTNDGNVPRKGNYTSYETATLVQGTSDVYDVYKSGTSFGYLLTSSTNVIEVLGANTTGITDMNHMFIGCSYLESVPLFDTSNVTNIESMFNSCFALTNIPLFDTSNVTNMYGMCDNCTHITSIPLFNTSKVTDISIAFRNCYLVESGALAIYNQASTQTTPPTTHQWAFRKCGRDTTTGAAELAQIPSDWK
jgi:surface protein